MSQDAIPSAAVPLATYREHLLLQWSKTYELWPDKVLVRGRQGLTTSFEIPVLLAELRPDFAKMKATGKLFGMWVCFALLLTPIWIVFLNLEGPFAIDTISTFAVWVMGWVGVLFVSRAKRLVLFYTKRGAAGLTIYQAGPEKEKFDGFVERVTDQIKLLADDGSAQKSKGP